MKILLIDPEVESRELLVERVQEAIDKAGVKRTELVDGDASLLELYGEDDPIACVFFGPGCYGEAEVLVQNLKASYPTVPAALVLENDVYADEAVGIRKELPSRVLALADIAQMAGFIIDSDKSLSTKPGQKNRGVIGVAQLKGGVGASTVAAGIASCWARNGLTVALVDLDDINPQITEWGRATPSQRHTVTEQLKQGEVPRGKINEIVHPVENYDGRLVVVPQPERYRDSFQFKADFLPGVPSSALYMDSLIKTLREEFDVIVIDFGRSWGISTMASLRLCQHVLLVTDDDGMSVRRTLDNLRRLVIESGDEEEFALSRWSLILNAYSGKLLAPKDLAAEIQEMDLFPESSVLYTMPFSEYGRQWGGPGESFYDLAEAPVRESIEKICFNLIPFALSNESSGQSSFMKTLSKLVGA